MSDLRATIRETLVANLFDGDDAGTLTAPIAKLVDDIVEILAEQGYTVTRSEDGRCPERCLGVEGHSGPHQTGDYVPPVTRSDAPDLRAAVSAALDVGIYPAASPGGPRTERQEGWNAAVIALCEAVETDFDAMRARHTGLHLCADDLPSGEVVLTMLDRCDFIQADDARRRLAEAADAVVRGWNATEREEWGKRFTQDIAALRAALAESGS